MRQLHSFADDFDIEGREAGEVAVAEASNLRGEGADQDIESVGPQRYMRVPLCSGIVVASHGEEMMRRWMPWVGLFIGFGLGWVARI